MTATRRRHGSNQYLRRRSTRTDTPSAQVLRAVNDPDLEQVGWAFIPRAERRTRWHHEIQDAIDDVVNGERFEFGEWQLFDAEEPDHYQLVITTATVQDWDATEDRIGPRVRVEVEFPLDPDMWKSNELYGNGDVPQSVDEWSRAARHIVLYSRRIDTLPPEDDVVTDATWTTPDDWQHTARYEELDGDTAPAWIRFTPG